MKVQQYSTLTSDAIEIHDRITFDFYTGLSHINSHVPYTLNSGNSLLDMNIIGSSKLDADIPGINFNKIRTQQFNQCGRLQMNSYKIVTIAEILSDI